MNNLETVTKSIAKRYGYTESFTLPLRQAFLTESVTLNLEPSSWFWHPSSIELSCIESPVDKCVIQGDIVSLPQDQKFVDEEIEGIFYTYRDEVYYPCRVASIHSYIDLNEIHNHVVCVVHGKNRALKTLDELIETAKEAERNLKNAQEECIKMGGVWTEKHACKIPA